MYDIYGMEKMLCKVGFVNMKQCSHNESSLANFAIYGLEGDGAGSEYKPNSLYVEATK